MNEMFSNMIIPHFVFITNGNKRYLFNFRKYTKKVRSINLLRAMKFSKRKFIIK